MKSLKNFVFTVLFATLALAAVGCSHSTGGGVGDGSGGGHEFVSLPDIALSGTTYEKTGETVVIPAGETVTVHMTDDSAWRGYYSGTNSRYKGVFIENRKVTLSPFAIGKYEVTQELFEAVMGANPSTCTEGYYYYKNMLSDETQKLRPVETVNWYAAIVFCNKLSILEGLEPCYSVKVSGEEVDWVNLAYNSIPSLKPNPTTNADWNAATCDFNKNGYRLPTEAEWEFAARGGDTGKETWKYSYAGVNTKKISANFTNEPYNDTALDTYGWYWYNLDGGASTESSTLSNGDVGYGTHEVGTKKPNTLGLYDMSGNVYEWCWDWYSSTVSTGAVTDPAGPASGSYRLLRGGSWYRNANLCAVSSRASNNPYDANSIIGFRLARSL